MDILEKVEILREKANISYEEAKNVLEAANGDLLDAMVILERQSKIRKPETEIAVSPEEAEGGESREAAGTEKASGASADMGREKKASWQTEAGARKVRRTVKKIADVLRNNSFHITRRDETLFTMPAWAFALILLFTWKWMIPVMLISLFFQVRYSFEGKDDMTTANDFMDKVGRMAEEVADEFKNRN